MAAETQKSENEDYSPAADATLTQAEALAAVVRNAARRMPQDTPMAIVYSAWPGGGEPKNS